MGLSVIWLYRSFLINLEATIKRLLNYLYPGIMKNKRKLCFIILLTKIALY